MFKKIFSLSLSLVMTLLMIQTGSFKANSENSLALSDCFICENGNIFYDSHEWYKVNCFESGKPYLITAENIDGTESFLYNADGFSEQNIWNYINYTNTTSTATPHSILKNGYLYLVCSENSTDLKRSSEISSDSIWVYQNNHLSFETDGETRYVTRDSESTTGLGYTTDVSRADNIQIYTYGNRLGKCITEQPKAVDYVIADSSYCAPSFAVSISDNVIIDSVTWYSNGGIYKTDSLEFTADNLTNKSTGVYQIYCEIEGHDDKNTYYRENSAYVSFVVTNGVIPNSFLSFSDLHEQFELIGKAIQAVMNENNGCIPSLIICTGDWVNGPSGSFSRVLNSYYPKLLAQFGGIDAVYVSGNHDNSNAAVLMSKLSGLGADTNSENECGVIFNGNSDEIQLNGKSSINSTGLIVYGLNYGAVSDGDAYSYKNAVNDIQKFLKKKSKDYNNELIIISAHSGLHVIGIQPQSNDRNSCKITEWGGSNAYNIDDSEDLVNLLNYYSSEYNMNILYLFGHNHSRNEAEIFMTDGDEIISTHSFSDMTTFEQTLNFTYAHSGYLSDTIGSANKYFSFVKKLDGGFSYNLMQIENGTVNHYEVSSKYIQQQQNTNIATITAIEKNSNVKNQTDSPYTADNFGKVIGIFLVALVLYCVSCKQSKYY